MTHSDVSDKKFIPQALAWILVAITFMVSVGVLAWGFDKGFLLSDGGHYLLRYQDIQPSETHTWILEHFLVKSFIPAWLRTITGLRYLGLCINLFSSALFGLAIWRVSKQFLKKGSNTPLLVLMMLAGLILSYSFLPCELSYLSLSQFFINISGSFLILSMLSRKSTAILSIIISAVSCSFLTITKIPAGSAFVALAVLALIMSKRRRSAVLFIVTWLIFLAMMWLHYRLDISWFITDIRQMLLNTDKNHFHVRALRPFELAGTLGGALIVAALISYSIQLFSKRKDSKAIQTAALIGITLTLTVWLVYGALQPFFGSYVKSDFIVMPIFYIVCTYLFRGISLNSIIPTITASYKRHREFAGIALLLLCIPYAGALGSWGSMNLMSKYFLISHLGMLYLLIPFWQFKYRNHIAWAYTIFLIAAGTWSYVMYPMGYGPLYKQTIEYKGIRYEPEMAKHLRLIEDTLRNNGFRKDQGIIAPLSPGIIYLMGSFSPGGILWSKDYLEGYLKNLKATELQLNPVVIICPGGMSDEFVNGLKEATGLDLNRDYRMEHNAELVGYWQIYFPIDKVR